MTTIVDLVLLLLLLLLVIASLGLLVEHRHALDLVLRAGLQHQVQLGFHAGTLLL